MKLRKTMAGVLACAMLATLAGCGSGGTSSAASTASTASGASGSAEGASYRVGVCQLMQHPALDSATQGFQDALTETFGDAVTFDVENASGDNSNCATIINSFVSSDVDLILANATTPLQAAAAATDSIPILGTSITDYATALDVTDWTGCSGRNISGTTDLAPLDGQADMIKELFPDAKNVGLLYCSAEPNSKYQVNVITEYLTELGYTCTEYSFSDTNDLSAVCTSACAASDVIYIPTDNTAANNTELIANITYPPGFPSWQASRVSAAAAAWPLCPSTITSWAAPPVRWPPRSSAAKRTSPPWRCSPPPPSPRCTTLPCASSWA